jgi:hypothetical protein
LRYGQRTWGVNLVWGDPAKTDNVRFQRQSGSKEPLKFDEPIAINLKGGGFLVYQKRDKGINLGWSQAPKFEWKISGGDAGSEVPANQLIGLHNNVENDSVMYEERSWGINLKWFKDSGKYNEVNEAIRAGKAGVDLLKVIFG